MRHKGHFKGRNLLTGWVVFEHMVKCKLISETKHAKQLIQTNIIFLWLHKLKQQHNPVRLRGCLVQQWENCSIMTLTIMGNMLQINFKKHFLENFIF